MNYLVKLIKVWSTRQQKASINMKLKPNIKAPNFKLPCTNNSVFELNNLKKHNIILYFYPKDDTPGCTIEAKDFSKLNNLISKNKSSVFGV